MLAILGVPEVSLPKASWVRPFFNVKKEPDFLRGHLARQPGWDLRKVLLPPGDEEIRLWYARFHNNNEVLFLRRKRGKWSAEKHFWGGGDKYDPDWSIRYEEPREGWSTFWAKVDELGFRVLPDDSTLPQNARRLICDGIILTVEEQANGKYRAYRYDNPQEQDKWPEAVRMAQAFRYIESQLPD